MIITAKKPIDNNVRVLGSHVYGDHEIHFYRNKKKDIFIGCSCGFDEVVYKNAPVANDNVASTMYEAIKKHVA